jgi:hypothetical protein
MPDSIPSANGSAGSPVEPVRGPKVKRAAKTRKVIWGLLKFASRP